MKKHLPHACSEWRRLVIGGAAVGMIYLVVALMTGLSAAVSRLDPPVLGSLCGIVSGCIFLAVNTLLLHATIKRIASGRSGPGIYRLSYAGRYLLAGVVLAVGLLFWTRLLSLSCWSRLKSPIWSARWPVLEWNPEPLFLQTGSREMLNRFLLNISAKRRCFDLEGPRIFLPSPFSAASISMKRRST